MPYTSNNDVQIHYEVEGSGPALMLAHGLGFSAADWQELDYVASLRDRYQVILVDGRGHGQSDKPHDPQAYSAALRVQDHVAVLNHLGLEKAHFWGYSSGGVMGFSAAKYAPDRFSAMIIGGLDPYHKTHDIGDRSPLKPKPFKGLPQAADPIRALLDAGGEAWLRFMQSNMDVPERMAGRLRLNDCQALTAQWEQPFPWQEDIRPLIPNFPFSCLLYAGDAEDACKGMEVCAEEMPRAQFLALPDYGHFDIFSHPESIIPQVLSFLARDAKV